MDLPVTERVVIPAADLSWRFSRAGGPGGQHVNTTESRVQLRFALSSTRALHPVVKHRLRAANPQWCTDDGDLLLASATHRSRHRNVEEVRARLAAAVRAALVPPKHRRPTKPSRAAKKRRLEAKKARGKIKSTRGRYRGDD